jgi:hypothetical protein
MEKKASGISPSAGAARLAGLVGRRPVDSYRHSIFVKPMARRLSNQVLFDGFYGVTALAFSFIQNIFPVGLPFSLFRPHQPVRNVCRLPFGPGGTGREISAGSKRETASIYRVPYALMSNPYEGMLHERNQLSALVFNSILAGHHVCCCIIIPDS